MIVSHIGSVYTFFFLRDSLGQMDVPILPVTAHVVIQFVSITLAVLLLHYAGTKTETVLIDTAYRVLGDHFNLDPHPSEAIRLIRYH